MTAIPTQADIGFPVRVHWAYDVGPVRQLNTVNTFVVHDTEGYMQYDEPVLANNDNNIASTHALIAPDGELVFMVPLEKTAWTPGNDVVARRSVNVEISGFAKKGYTDAQYRSVAAFFNWCIAQGCPIPATYVGKSGTAGIIGHQDVPNPYVPGKFGGASGHTDPGPLFDWLKLTEYINEGNDIGLNVNEGPKMPQPFDPNPQGFKVGQGMLDRATADRLTFITNEQYFSPNAGQAGLGQMSRAWAQDAAGVTYVLMASEQPELAKPGQATPWKVEKLQVR